MKLHGYFINTSKEQNTVEFKAKEWGGYDNYYKTKLVGANHYNLIKSDYLVYIKSGRGKYVMCDKLTTVIPLRLMYLLFLKCNNRLNEFCNEWINSSRLKYDYF